MIRKIHKNNRNKTDTCLEGWGVGDTHFTGSHIGGIHISLGICVRGYTYHGDTHITVTPGPVFDPPPKRMSAGSFSRTAAGNRA